MTDKQKSEKSNVKIDPVKRVGFPVFGFFPVDKMEEYLSDVDKNWGGCRFAKAWHDHELAKKAQKEEAMWEMILQLKHEISILAKQGQEPEKKEEEVKTLGKQKEAKKK